MRDRKWQEKSERHFRLVRTEVLGAPSFPVPFQSVAPDVLIYTCGTWGWKIHLLCSLWLCGVQWRDENWVLLLCHITGSFSIAISPSAFSCILSMITSVECILLLLLSVVVVLGKPLVIVYKDRCKHFIPCIKSLCLTTSFWICVEHCDFFDKRLCQNLLSATAEGYLKRSLCLLHRTLCPLKTSHYYERVHTAWKVALGDLGSSLFSCWKLGIWLPGRNVSLHKWHPYLSRRRVERLSIPPPTYPFFYLN